MLRGPAVASKPDLVQLTRELRGERRPRLDADLGRSVRDLRDDGVGNARPSCRVLERGRVLLGNPAEVVFPLDVRTRRIAHRKLRRFAGREQLERSCDGGDLVLVDRHLQGDVVGQLGEPAEVADDERSSEGQRSDRAARGLAHRRRAQGDAGVAGSHQRPEAVLLDVPDAFHAVGHQAVGVEAGRGGADEEELRVRMALAHQTECLDQLGNALARIQMTEAPEHRTAFDGGRLHVDRRPGRVLDTPDRAVVAGLARAVLDVVRVDDQPGCVCQHLADERKLGRARLPRWRHTSVEDSVREQASGNSSVAFHRREIAVTVLPADREPGDEVVQDEVVQDDDTRPSSQRIDDPAVRLRIVADVKQRDVRCDRAGASAPDDLELDEAAECRQEQRGVVGDPGPLRRER